MGSESGPFGDLLVVSDFAEGSLLRIDVSDPTDMVASTLVANTGTTPNGVTIQNGVATVVNWGNNADILQVDVATGEVTTLIDGTGLGFCDGVDWANGSLIVSSWNPQRISRFTPNATTPTGWTWKRWSRGRRWTIRQTSASTPMETGTPWHQWEQHGLLWRFAHGVCSPRGQSALDSGLIDRQWRIVQTEAAGHWTVRGYDVMGRLLGVSDALHHSAGEQNWTFDNMGDWVSSSTFLEMHFEASGYGAETWTTTLKRALSVDFVQAGSTSMLMRNRFQRESALNSSKSA